MLKVLIDDADCLSLGSRVTFQNPFPLPAPPFISPVYPAKEVSG
jgi:hypothetical protein